MVFNFKKNIAVGVAVTPEKGLEVAQIDFATKTILKYGSKQLGFDSNRKEISDLDIFKETLQELLTELEIPAGSEIVLSIPPAAFKIADYPASLTEEQIGNVVEEELAEHNLFRENEPAYSVTKLPNSTIQFNKIAYTASSRVMLIEIAMQIKDMGYSLVGIEPTVNSSLNALIYNERIDAAPNNSWVMLIVENNCCRILPMMGRNFVESFEERISIGEVLGDEENYSTVVNAVNPILRNLPSQRLYVISKTNVISAKALAGKLVYNAQIIHQEANCYTTEAFLEFAPEIAPEIAQFISLDVIGAAIFNEFEKISNTRLNLFNTTLGDVYLNEQPLSVEFGGRTLKFSMENMIKASILFAVPFLLIAIIMFASLSTTVASKENQLNSLKAEIAKIKKDLEAHANISTEVFDEGDEIRIGIVHNKNLFTYYQIVGTEIPKKLWLTSLELGKYTTIEGQADNLESIYSFFRSIKDYNPQSAIKLQSLGLATTSKLTTLGEEGEFDTNTILTTMNADFYKFRISDDPVVPENKNSKNKKSKKLGNGLEPLPDDIE